MPKVQQYQPNQVQTNPAAQPNAQGAPEGAFGGQVINAVSDLALSAQKVKQRIDITSAEEALVGFEREKNALFFNPDTGYFNSQGRDAYDQSATISKNLEELKKTHGDALGPGARILFDSSADVHITRAGVDISRHAAKGLKAWEVATLESQIENSIESGSLYWNDPDRVKVNRELGRGSVLDSGEMQGLSAETIAENLQTFESVYAKSIITAALNSSSVDGEAAIEKHGDRLEGPDKIKIDELLERKKKIEKTQSDAIQAISEAGRLVRDVESRSEIINEVNKIEDPELRKKTMTESMNQFNRKKTAEKEVSAEFYNQGIEHVNNGGSAEEFKAQQPEAWEGMSSLQRNNLLAGKHTTTDQIKLNTILSLPRDELVKVNPVDLVGDLNPADVTRVRSAVNKAKQGQSITSIQTVSSKVNLIAEQFFGKKSSWQGNRVKTAKVQSLMEAVQSDIEEAENLKQGKLTPTEIDSVLADFSRRFVIQRSFAGIDFLASDIEIDLSNTEASKVSELSQFVDAHGDESLQSIVNLLRDNDKPVTAETIIKAFRQATQ